MNSDDTAEGQGLNGQGTARAVKISPHRPGEPEVDSTPEAQDPSHQTPGTDADEQNNPGEETEEQESGDASPWMDGAHAAGAELPPE